MADGSKKQEKKKEKASPAPQPIVIPTGYKKELPGYDIEGLLTQLFDKAKEIDEFEYCSTFLRIRGMEGPGWDPLRESLQLMDQVWREINAPIDPGFRLRLMLFAYCHATEMHDLYHVVGNMLRICGGKRYSMDCFAAVNHPSGQKAKYPSHKASRIKEWADAEGMNELGEMFSELVVNQLRNAFFHSDYTLYQGNFRIVRGDGVPIGNMIEKELPPSWLLPRLELGINAAFTLVQLVTKALQSYTKNKIVMGRAHGDDQPPVPVELTVQEGYGLVGFVEPPSGTQ